MGVMNGSCICFDDSQFKMDSIDDSVCKICVNSDLDSCGSENAISIYRLYEDNMVKWANGEPSHTQCIYGRKAAGDHIRIEAYTTSCYSQMTSSQIDGFFCANSAYSVLNETCSNRDKSERHCLINGPISRHSAEERCSIYNGILVNLNSERDIVSMMESDRNYWLGVYRAFAVYESDTVNTTACLSVTKVGYRLHLDPDNCSEKKTYLYESNHTYSTTAQRPSPTLTKQNTHQPENGSSSVPGFTPTVDKSTTWSSEVRPGNDI